MNAPFFVSTSRKLVAHILYALGAILRRSALALVFSLGLASSLFAAESAPSTSHTFRDGEGRTVEASIARVIEPNVFLQHGDGEPFKVKIDVFGPEDQAFIRRWAREHSSPKSSELSQIFATPGTSGDSDASSAHRPPVKPGKS